jgi:micrococcal nuclease
MNCTPSHQLPPSKSRRHRVWLIVGLILSSLLLTLSILVILLGVPSPAFAAFRIIQVYDGDNIAIVQGGIKTKVQLACIAAPELAQPFGKDARKRLQSLINSQDISLRLVRKDRLGRYIAEVFSQGQNVNHILVAEGLAQYDVIQAKDCAAYGSLEASAHASHLGIWQGKKPPQSPKEFRQQNERGMLF